LKHQLDEDARGGVDGQAAFAQFQQRDGRIGNSQPFGFAAFGVMVGKADGDVIDRFPGAIDRRGASGIGWTIGASPA
jgi:hypothetical protein